MKKWDNRDTVGTHNKVGVFKIHCSMEKNPIIVTGAAGFIGANVVAALNKLGRADIIIVDHLTNDGRWRNLAGLQFSEYYDKEVFLDILEQDQIKNIEAIIHLGACADTTEKDENFLIQNNTLYSQRIFDFCARLGVRLLYASSAATYGNGGNGYKDTERVLSPLNCYGYSKYLFDQWVLAASKKPPQWAGFKFFNVYGPKESHKGFMSSAIYHSYCQARDTGIIKLFKSGRADCADGDQKRDFIYIEDVLKVVAFFLKNSNINGLYNVGTGTARSYKDLALAVFAALGKEPQIQYVEMPEHLNQSYQYFTEADITSLRKAGFQEQFYSLENGVKDYVKNYD